MMVAMSKVAQYLNEHLQGEVTTADAVRQRFATDASVLRIVPDMVVHPRSTSDIRKVARFSWQLAEKGHKLPITVRGGGSDQTGAAIGPGAIINTLAHLNRILEIDPKQKLVRLQPGVTFKSLNDALALHNLVIPMSPASAAYSTLGGAIANNATGVSSDKYGTMRDWVGQLEVVLANGDIIQTGRINKRELGRRKGLQTFEGEIYRAVDNLITDNTELISSIATDMPDNSGYNIIDVKRRDGSIDLTPLFIGSQGTLGIVSEVIMKIIETPRDPLVGAIAFADHDAARDGLDQLRSLGSTSLELIDGRLFEHAATFGKSYPFYDEARGKGDVAAIVVFEFDNHSGRAKKHAGKKIAKLFEKDEDTTVAIERGSDKIDTLRRLRDVTTLTIGPEKAGVSAPPLLDGAYIPPERLEDFAKTVKTLESRHHVDIALYGHAGQSVYYARPLFDLAKVGDRQKLLKLLADWTTAVSAHGGHTVAEAGEGRLKAPFAYNALDSELVDLISSIRDIFDPQGVLNTGVKQAGDLKQLANSLRADYDGSDFAAYAPSN